MKRKHNVTSLQFFWNKTITEKANITQDGVDRLNIFIFVLFFRKIGNVFKMYIAIIFSELDLCSTYGEEVYNVNIYYYDLQF